jgi:hypothetical protein
LGGWGCPGGFGIHGKGELTTVGVAVFGGKSLPADGIGSGGQSLRQRDDHVSPVVVVNAGVSFVCLGPGGTKHFQGVGPCPPKELLSKPDVNFGRSFCDHRSDHGFRPVIFGVRARRLRESG